MTAPLPFQSLDKAFVAGTLPPWASFAPTWRLQYRGTLDEAQLLRALGWVLARYPWCAGRAIDLHWVLPQQLDARSQFTVLDLRGVPEPERAAREHAVANRFLVLEKEPPLQLTWVRRTDDTGLLMFQQHHALADGRSFLGLLADFVRCLDAPSETPLPSALVTRRPEPEAIPERGWARAVAFVRGAFHTLWDLTLASVAPLTPFFSNRGQDYAGSDCTRHVSVPISRLERWTEGRKKLGLSSNDLLVGALCVALARWSRALGAEPNRHNILMPVDVRPRLGFESFANHLSWLQLRWKARADLRPLALAAELHRVAAPVLAARLPWKRVLFDAWLTRLTPLKVLRYSLFEKRQLLTNYSFSNLTALGTPGAAADGKWRSAGVEFQRLLITTPCTPPQGANTTVIRYGDALCFNFNFKDSVVSAEQMERLTEQFSTALDELDEDLKPGSASISG